MQSPQAVQHLTEQSCTYNSLALFKHLRSQVLVLCQELVLAACQDTTQLEISDAACKLVHGVYCMRAVQLLNKLAVFCHQSADRMEGTKLGRCQCPSPQCWCLHQNQHGMPFSQKEVMIMPEADPGREEARKPCPNDPRPLGSRLDVSAEPDARAPGPAGSWLEPGMESLSRGLHDWVLVGYPGGPRADSSRDGRRAWGLEVRGCERSWVLAEVG